MLSIDLSRKINEEQAWSVILQYVTWKRDRFTSPFRMDKTPDCYLYNDQGSTYLYDPVSGSNYNVITAYAKLNGLTNKESYYQLINQHYNAVKGICTTTINTKKTNNQDIDISISWTNKGNDFWKYLGVKDLSNIHQIDGYYLNGIFFQTKELVFAYQYLDKFKLYEPFGRRFFFGNVTKNHTWHIKNGSNTLFICKSAKDQKVTESLLGTNFDYIHVQGENMFPDWEYWYENCIIFFDNDVPGTLGALKMKGHIFKAHESHSKPFPSIREIFIPDPKYKDCSDYYKVFGRAETFKLITHLI